MNTDTAMLAPTTPPAETVGADQFDTNAQKGWEFFTKFLLSNVIVTIAALVFVALLTVWR